MKITSMTLFELSDQIRKKTLSSAEITDAYLKKIAETDEKIGAYLTVCADSARKTAEKCDKETSKGRLWGIPVGIKDNICTKGVRTTCASGMLEDFVPVYDAGAWTKLENSGAVLLGKLNMDEFAMGSSTENSYFHPTHNPHDPERVPGGSSGGSAAAVAAELAPYTLGSDTGGSVRQPAAFCGVVGMKPTYGSVSRNGLIAFASSLDQIGPITKDVRDNALVLDAIRGHDPMDSTSVNADAPSALSGLEKGVRGLKIALPKEFFAEGISLDVKECVLAAAKTLEGLGAIVDYVSMPLLSEALPAYYILSGAEASSNLARFDGIRYGYRTDEYRDVEELYRKSRSEGFGREVKRRIMLGTFALSAGYYDAYYKKALQMRRMISDLYGSVFKNFDLILSPTAPTIAYKLGEKTEDPMEMYLGDIYTVPVSIAGLPALSVPCGKGNMGMPVGMQLIGRAFDEATIYQAAYAYEQSKGGERK
ncbi:MAG: Asp-tRNA(Asn)/Glu-tRNA(Gln) amidotransferase subunit GatA [Eubacteriales bacterium]